MSVSEDKNALENSQFASLYLTTFSLYLSPNLPFPLSLSLSLSFYLQDQLLFGCVWEEAEEEFDDVRIGPNLELVPLEDFRESELGKERVKFFHTLFSHTIFTRTCILTHIHTHTHTHTPARSRSAAISSHGGTHTPPPHLSFDRVRGRGKGSKGGFEVMTWHMWRVVSGGIWRE